MAKYGVEYENTSYPRISLGRMNTSRTMFVGYKEEATQEAVWAVVQYVEGQGGEFIVKCEDCGGPSYKIRVEEMSCGG